MSSPTSQIKLYKSCKIIESENYIVDDISLYLASLTATTFSSSQFIRNGLDIEIKVILNAMDVNSGATTENYNYAEIEIKNTEAGKTPYTCYYFIRKITEVGEGSVRLSLHMDVINTFRHGNGFTIANRTIVKREHKDRYVATDSTHYGAVVDFYPEGINPTLYRDSGHTILEDSSLGSYGDLDFYLIYKNSLEDSEDTNNVVNCFLACDGDMTYTYTPLNPTITPSQLEEGKWYYFFYDSATGFDGVDYFDSLNSYTFLSNTGMIACIKVGDSIMGYFMRYNGSSVYNPPYDSMTPDLIEVHALSQINLQAGDYYYKSSGRYTKRSEAYSHSTQYTASTAPITITATKYSDVNKTDSRIIKIIKIPYAPTEDIEVSGTSLIFDEDIWEYDQQEGLIRLLDLNADFVNTHITDSVVDVFASKHNILNTYAKINQLRATMGVVEPKIYHSEFFYTKYMYDSFSKVIRIEELNENLPYTAEDLIIEFHMTKTINSRFMFYFNEDDWPTARVSEDYYSPLVVQRNNEEVIYSSPYINYLRTGYNYDVKSKNRQEFFGWFNTALGMGAGALSVALGSKVLGVQMIASTIASIGNSINSTITAEQNLEAKVHALKWQANSVYGADDVDLMSRYAHNKLLRVTYQCSPRMRKLLDDLFFYTGYINNEMKIPNVSTRIWFNFLACDLKFDMVRNIAQDCLEEIHAKYEAGVTFLHKNKLLPTDSFYTWDFDRKYLNWETYLIN